MLAGLLLVAVTAPALALCVGDCDASGDVTVDEIILCVNIALGKEPLSSCPVCDRDRSGDITVDELVAAVLNALNGCPSEATATPTRTPSPTATPSNTPMPPPVGQVLFHEGWENSQVTRYGPDAIVTGDTGPWAVGDTISAYPDCGASPNYGEVIVELGSKRLRLHSAHTDTDCSDNVFIGPVTLNPPGPRVLHIPADAGVYFSFTEHGTLNNPDGCDAVLMGIGFDEGRNSLTYVLERGSTWDSNQSDCENLTVYNTILLPPGRGSYVRNPRADFISLGFSPPEVITTVAMEVDSHGDATFDDITFFRAAGSTPPPTPTRTPTPSPGGCIRVQQGLWCFEFPSLEAEDDLTQSGCIVTFADASMRGPLSGSFWSVDNPDYDVTIRGSFSGNPATEFTGTVSTPQGSGPVSGQVGPCPE
jgi:hypothetical protein